MDEKMIFYLGMLGFFTLADFFCISRYLKGQGLKLEYSVGAAGSYFVQKNKVQNRHRIFLLIIIFLLSIAVLNAAVLIFKNL
jgi:hypothetical protein